MGVVSAGGKACVERMGVMAKERPILFSGAMVQALLAGRKTQTRRVIKWHEREDVIEPEDDNFLIDPEKDGVMWPYQKRSKPDGCVDEIPLPCPYGVPGDRLWVKETHYIGGGRRVRYAATPDVLRMEDGTTETAIGGLPARWRPSIHMPRWASRITLEVVSVRVERVKDISAADAEAEGVGYEETRCDGECSSTPCSMAVGAYAKLWDSINGDGSWAANPWVWVVEFKRV